MIQPDHQVADEDGPAYSATGRDREAVDHLRRTELDGDAAQREQVGDDHPRGQCRSALRAYDHRTALT